jgi:site-specific recombinase XerD
MSGKRERTATAEAADRPVQLVLFAPEGIPAADGAGRSPAGGPDAPAWRLPSATPAAPGRPTRPAADHGTRQVDGTRAGAPVNRPDTVHGQPPRPRPRAVTLKAAMEEYREYLVAINMAKHTRDSFGLDLKLLLEHLGDVPLGVIGERELRSFISWVRLERRNNAISVRRKVASLKNFFSYLHRERAIPSDPSLRLLYPEIFPALPEFLEDFQVASLLEAAAEHTSWHALIALMLETGLKRDEVVALGWTDVNLGEADGQPGYLVVRETEHAKRLRSRRLEIRADVALLLRRYRAGEARRERFFDLSPRGVNFIVETCGKRAGIETRASKLTPQILRETFAVRQMRAMVAAEEAQRRAGASDEAVAALIEQHDIGLLRLLGLHEEPESAKKYRKLVHGWTGSTRADGGGSDGA